MKTTRINGFFESFGRFQIKHRTAFLVALVIFTVIGCLGLPRLKLSNGEADWFDNWDQVKMNQDHFEDIFGSTDSLLAFVKADDVFDPEVLDAIDRLGNEILKSVPYVESVTSLMNLSVPIGTEEGFEVYNPFEDGIPEDPEELQAIRDFILSRESLVNVIVSDDCTETWVIFNLEQYSESLEEAKDKIAPPAMEIFNSDEFKSEKYRILPAGLSYTEYEEDKEVVSQCISRISVGFAVMVLFLIVFVRSVKGVIVPALATVFALCTTLGYSAWMNIEGNMIMVIVTLLLAMALSVGYAIHFINSFKLHFRRTGDRRSSVVLGTRDCGWALLFTVITTMAGMLSFLAGGIRPMRWVGGITAAAVLSVYIYTMILLPILCSYGRDTTPEPKYVSTAGSTKADLRIECFGAGILNRSTVILVVGFVLLAAMMPGVLGIEVNMDYTDMMGKRTPYVKRLLEITNSKLGSQYSYEVLIEYAQEDAIKNPEILEKMDELTARIGTLSMTKVSNGKPRVSSVTKIIKEMNRTLNEDDIAFYAIPDDQDLVAQILFLYEISGGNDVFQYVSEDFSAAYLHVELSGYDAEQCVQNVDQVEEWVDELFPDAETAGVVGEVMQYAAMNGKLVRGSLRSIGTSFIVIFILLMLAFGSVRTGAIAMIPNIAPVLLIGGVMGYARIPLDMVTALIMPMILGIAVDDTIHFTNHIKVHFEECGEYRKAILNSYREIGKTMAMTTVILCAMFFIFVFSTMTALCRIGYLSVIGLAGALVADYTLTPILILLTKPFGKEKRK
jgi:hypothetical protein